MNPKQKVTPGDSLDSLPDGGQRKLPWPQSCQVRNSLTFSEIGRLRLLAVEWVN